MSIKSYEDLEIYKEGYNLALKVHQSTQEFPKHEWYELGSQLRRAAMSVPLNIAEGYGRRGKDFKRFLTYALGSCNEVKVLLHFCQDLGYMRSEELLKQYNVLGRRIYSLRNNWN